MKKTLEWKDARLGWKLLALCALIILALPWLTGISKEGIGAVTGLLLLLNSAAIFRAKELDTQDFFLYALPVSRAKILASKYAWVILCILALMILCFYSWGTVHGETQAPNPYWILPMLFLPALVPVVLSLYFRSSQITTLVVSLIATLLWGFVALLLFPYIRLPLIDPSTYHDFYGTHVFTLFGRGWIDYVLILLGLVGWSFYVFCRTRLTEKSHSRSTLLGIEFVVLFAWFAYVILGANLRDIWYLLFG
jgi:ABC-type transport system involved in multi-copper enzyme maturation permease subunit